MPTLEEVKSTTMVSFSYDCIEDILSGFLKYLQNWGCHMVFPNGIGQVEQVTNVDEHDIISTFIAGFLQEYGVIDIPIEVNDDEST